MAKPVEILTGNQMTRRTILLTLLLLLPFGVQALGLNNITVNSFLNEKLDARIDLTSVGSVLIDDIRVALADAAAFEAMGLERPFQLSKLRFKVQTGADQRPYIQIGSKGSIREPYLDFLLEVNWPGGKLLRQYTLLLDPRTYSPTLSAASKRPAVSSQAAGRPRVSTSSPPLSQSYGPVRGTDTLWVIAKKTRPDSSVTVQQMMMALQRRNPGAFSRGNVNLLRKGAVLAIPGMDAIREMTPREASEAFREQTRQWKAMRKSAQRAVPTAEVRAVPETAPSARESKIQSPGIPPGQRDDRQPDTALDAVVPPPDVDELSPEEKQLRVVEAKQDWPADEESGSGVGTPENERLKQAIASSEDDLKAVKEINRDLDELRTVLETKIETLRKSLEEKNRAIENLQQRLKLPAVAEEPVGDGSGGESIQVPDRKGTPTDLVTEVEPPGVPAMVPRQMEKEEATKPEIWLKEYWMHLALAGVSILLVLTLIALGRAKRREAMYAEADTQFPESYVELDDTPVPDEEVVDRSQQTPSQPPADDGEDALDEPRDLIADAGEEDYPHEPGKDISGALSEADVYLAYHRYGRAESVIKDAIALNPDSMMLKAKLLEIYAFRKDKKQFTSFMEKLYESTDEGSSELWARIVEMGRDLIPDHPLIAHTDLKGFGDGDEQIAEAGLSIDKLDLDIPDEEQRFAEVNNADAAAPAPEEKTGRIELHDLGSILEHEDKNRRD